MFRLLRYFSITSLVAFIIAVLLLGLFYHQLTISDLVFLQEQQHIVLTQTMSNSLQPLFEPNLDTIAKMTPSELRASPIIRQLRQDVLAQIADTSIMRVKIYNTQGLTIFSTQEDQLGEDEHDDVGVQAALAGHVESELTYHDFLPSFEGDVEQSDLFSSYIPLRDRQSGAILGAFEIYTDVTGYLKQSAQTQLRMLLGMILMLVGLYVALFIIVRRADRIIRQQAVERQRANEQLRRQALTFENIHDSVLITDFDGLIIDCNPATEQIFGYTRDELIGSRMSRWPCFDQRMLRMVMRATNTGPQRWAGEIGFTNKLGVSGTCDVVVVPLSDAQGQPLGRIWASHDVSAHKQSEAALVQARDAAEEASRAKSLFLANMSHELRTPLTSIIGYSDLLEKEFEQNGQKQFIPDLFRIQLAGQHLLTLINDILDLSKIEAGRMTLHLETFSLDEMIDHLLMTIQPLISQKQNTLHIQRAADLGIMHADEAKVRQILLNLLSNAAKFTERGQITLSVSRAAAPGDERIVFCVSDTGIGMAPGQLENLFQPFTQGDNSATRKYGGAGLGLAICRRLCEMMNGYIDVTSALGAGSSFVVQLPARVMPLGAGASRASEHVSV